MNHQISWDPSLVKKFSSSNHFKLLNQLRNEVKKYPLNNKNNNGSIQNKETNINKSKSNNTKNKIDIYSKNSEHDKEFSTNKTTVSFNNSKNFSIYNHDINNSNQKDTEFSEHRKSNNYLYAKTFTDRLNQIDMK